MRDTSKGGTWDMKMYVCHTEDQNAFDLPLWYHTFEAALKYREPHEMITEMTVQLLLDDIMHEDERIVLEPVT